MAALPSLGCKPHPHLSLPRSPLFLHNRRHQNSSSSLHLSSAFSKSSRLSIRASNSDSPSPSFGNPSHANSPKTPDLISAFKLPLCIAAAAASLFFSRLSPFRPLPALAEAATAETVTADAQTDASESKVEQAVEEEERKLEEHLASNPNDVEALKFLVELKMRTRKLPEVIEISSRLIDLEPDEVEWRLMKGHTYCYTGEYEAAKSVFEEVLAKNPNQVEAYHGLVMSASQLDVDDGKELSDVERRIQEAVANLKKANKREDVREFSLLIAQIRVVQGDYLAALNVYEDLVKEEPRDYRPYLCQGIIYTLLRKKKEADEQFQKYKRLVPKDHPYANYFEENVKNTAKVFSEAGEK